MNPLTKDIVVIGNGYVLITFDRFIVPPYSLAMEWQGQGSLPMQLSTLTTMKNESKKMVET